MKTIEYSFNSANDMEGIALQVTLIQVGLDKSVAYFQQSTLLVVER